MSKKLPSDVYYTARNGGMWVRWNGRPEGQICYTFDREVAYGQAEEIDDPQAGMTSDGWTMTPHQGASGSCYVNRITKLAAEYCR